MYRSLSASEIGVARMPSTPKVGSSPAEAVAVDVSGAAVSGAAVDAAPALVGALVSLALSPSSSEQPATTSAATKIVPMTVRLTAAPSDSLD